MRMILNIHPDGDDGDLYRPDDMRLFIYVPASKYYCSSM